MKIDLEKAFPAPRRKNKGNPRTYDVNITFVKNGSNGMKVRFSFLNEAAKASANYDYVEVSSILFSKEYLFFRFFKDRQSMKTYKLLGRTKFGGSCDFSITPTNEESKAYRMYWIGKTYKLHYDEESELFYVSNN